MQNHSFEEARNKELLHILKLSEYSPEIVKNYIAIELGNNLEVKQYEDKYLSEYLDQQIQLQKQINNLTIQLGEYSE